MKDFGKELLGGPRFLFLCQTSVSVSKIGDCSLP